MTLPSSIDPPSPQTERLGVSAAEYFFAQNGWMFREQMTHDWGIDAHVEIVQSSRPTGRLVALQIKSGVSFFLEETAEAYVYRTDDKHVDYWLEHSMPVVLLLYHPDLKEMFWEKVTQQTIESTGKHWKIAVPKQNSFSNAKFVLRAFAALTQPEPYVRRLNRLRIDRPWMELLDGDRDVYVEFDDWVNKSLPRFQLRISCDGKTESWPMVYGPGMTIQDLLNHYLPWAYFSLDVDAHREGAESDWAAQCYMYSDPETGTTHYSETFDEWYKQPTGNLVPVSSDGEIDTYRLVLSLNELGEAFLQVDDHLSEDEDFELKSFTLEQLAPAPAQSDDD